MAAVYDQDAGNATLYVDGVAVTSQTFMSRGGMISRSTNSSQQAISPESDDERSFATALRVGAGASAMGATDGKTGLIGFVDELFVYGTALSVDELDFLYGAAQVRPKARSNISEIWRLKSAIYGALYPAPSFENSQLRLVTVLEE